MSRTNQAPNFTTLIIMWVAFQFSGIVLAGMTYLLVKPDGFEFDPAQFKMMLTVFGGLTVSMIAPSLFARKFIVKQQLAAKKSPSKRDVMSTYTTGSIIAWALAESISIYGFVLHMLSYKQGIALPFAGLGLVLLWVNMPRMTHVEALLESVTSKPEPKVPEIDQPDGEGW